MTGRSLVNAEQIDRKWFPSIGTLSVSAIREATLNDDLSQIRVRRLRHIEIATDRESGKPVLQLEWREAQWLAHALEAALDATRDLRPEDEL